MPASTNCWARCCWPGPRAQAAAKALIRAVAHQPIDARIIADTAERIAVARASAEGKEGVGRVPRQARPGVGARGAAARMSAPGRPKRELLPLGGQRRGEAASVGAVT